MEAQENDPELMLMAKEEASKTREKLAKLERELLQDTPESGGTDTALQKRGAVVLEIRAGTGGDEAAIFARDLLEAYAKFAKRQGWDTWLTEASPGGKGYNRAVMEIRGRSAHAKLENEGGVHRVQRVPETETQGRIHTSTATVAVMPEPTELEVKIGEDDLRVDTFNASGHGGQSVNKTQSAVRIVHLPTGITVTCQDERSQKTNRDRAMTVLRAKLHEAQRAKAENEANQHRRGQIGTGDRTQKIRTYNYPQDRITDHRTTRSTSGIARFMAGQLEETTGRIAPGKNPA